MKLYYAYEGSKVTSSVQEDYDRIDAWKLIHPNWILQEEVSRDNSILKQVDGVISIDEEGIAERALIENKATHEQNAYAQQNAYFNANKKAIFDAVVYNRPPTDMTQLPKLNTYKIFMEALWLAYHTRIATGSVDFDYTSIKPTVEYSYVEMEQEWRDYNDIS
jgi:hypothetical protein